VKSQRTFESQHYSNDNAQTTLPHNDWKNAREVSFVNRMEEAIDIYFVNETDDSEILRVTKLSPDAVHHEITYHMHRFRAILHGDDSRRIVKEFQIKDIEILDCELPKSNNNPEHREPETVNEDTYVREIGWTWAISNRTILGTYSI